jgi:hypothetical protein
MNTDHLEVVNLLTNLLGKQRRQAVAGRDISTAVVLARRPGVVELDTRAEGDVPSNARRSDRSALRIRAIVAPTLRKEIILTLNLHVVVRARPC